MTLTEGEGGGCEETLFLVSRYFFSENWGGGGGVGGLTDPGSSVPVY